MRARTSSRSRWRTSWLVVAVVAALVAVWLPSEPSAPALQVVARREARTPEPAFATPRIVRPHDGRALASSRRVAGRVVLRTPDGRWEGVPATLRHVAGAAERLSDDDLVASRVVPVRDDGAFAFDAGDAAAVWCVAEHVDAVAAAARFSVPSHDVTLELEPAGKLWLRVLGHTGELTVLLRGDGDDGGAPRLLRAAGHGDSVGCGGIPLAWGSVRVAVQLAGGRRIDVAEPAALAFRSWNVVTIDTTGDLAAVRGVVHDEAGRPLADVFVHSHPADRDPNQPPRFHDGRTRADGTFELKGLPAGVSKLSLSKPDYSGMREDLTLAHGEQRDLGVRVLRAGARVRGRVAPERPDHEASIVLRELGDASRHVMLSGQRAQPDAEGRFELRGVAPGEHLLVLTARQAKALTAPWSGIVVRVGPDDTVVDVGTLQGASWSRTELRVESPTGEAVAGWRVIARGSGAAWASYGTVRADGTVALEVGGGPFLLGLVVDAGALPQTVWCGVLAAGASGQVVRVPHGEVVMTRDGARDETPFTLELVYEACDGWPADVLPLECYPDVLRGVGNEIRIARLPFGAFRVLVARGSVTRDVVVRVTAAAPSVRAAWPF